MARQWQVLLVVTAGAFLANLDLFIVNIAFPAIGADFPGTSLAGLSWVLNGYAIVFAALLVPAGRLADLVGQKRIFLTGLSVFVLASVLCAASPDPAFLIGARVIQAAGAALLIPTSLALLLPEFAPGRRAAAIGLWTAGTAVAATIGPTIGGLLVEASWRWVFLVNLPLGLITGVAAWRILRERRDPERGVRPDLLGAGLLTVGIAAVALGIVKGPDWGWASPACLGAFAVSVTALALFARRSATHAAPVVEPALLRVPSFVVADTGVFLFSMGFFSLLLSTVLFLTQVWHYSALEAGLAFAPGPLAVALVSWPAGRLAGRLGPARLVGPGVTLFAAGCAWWIWRAGTHPHYLTDLLPGIILSGLGVGFTFPVLAGVAVGGLPAARAATGSAVFNMSRQIGGVLGVSVLIALLGASPDLTGFREGWVFMAAASVAALACAVALRRTPRRAAAPRPGTELGAPLSS